MPRSDQRRKARSTERTATPLHYGDPPAAAIEECGDAPGFDPIQAAEESGPEWNPAGEKKVRPMYTKRPPAATQAGISTLLYTG